MILAQALTKAFRNGAQNTCILSRLDLRLEEGEALAVTGPSGSGKSTLLHICGTLDHPTSGSLSLFGLEPFTLGEKELSQFRNQTIGFVFQDHYLLPQYSVVENVLLPVMAHAKIEESHRKRAAELLERVGLERQKNQLPGTLSGGERQRAAVARALINQPRLLLCDEPTGNLDPENAEKIGSLIIDVQRESQAILIVVTHSMALARRFPRQAALNQGVLQFSQENGPK